MSAIIRANNIVKYYGDSQNQQLVLDNVSIEIITGSFTAVAGTSGAGKSTLLSIMGGIEKATSGEVLFNDCAIHELDENKLASIRNQHFGFIFQSPHFVPYKSLIENVMLPSHYQHKVSEKELVTKAESLLDSVGLLKHKNKSPALLSGGEQQRMSFARALMLEPDIIFADEPTANLDHKNSEILLTQLRALTKQSKTIVLVSHDPQAIEYADSVHYLDKREHSFV